MLTSSSSVQVMELVELIPLRNALVGLPGVSGLSVEQRKRLTIAVELVANPSAVFMDEPTSGELLLFSFSHRQCHDMGKCQHPTMQGRGVQALPMQQPHIIPQQPPRLEAFHKCLWNLYGAQWQCCLRAWPSSGKGSLALHALGKGECVCITSRAGRQGSQHCDESSAQRG